MLLFPAVLRSQLLSVDFSRSGIWGKLVSGVQDICLKSCAKFPPNRTMGSQLSTLTPALVMKCPRPVLCYVSKRQLR